MERGIEKPTSDHGKLEKQTYTRQEVIDLINKALDSIGYDIHIQTYPDGTVQSVDATDWINKNLK